MNNDALVAQLELLVRARYPLLYLVSAEEDRVRRLVARVARRRSKPLQIWTETAGLVPAGTSLETGGRREPGSADPQLALEQVLHAEEAGIYLFHDLHPYLAGRHSGVVRRLREVALWLRRSAKTVMLCSPLLVVPPELEKDLTVIDVPLPRREDLAALLDEVAAHLADGLQLPAEQRDALIDAARGLTATEFENVLARLVVSCGTIAGHHAAAVYAEKQQILRKSQLLDYIEPDVDLEAVGGLEALKQWLTGRRLAFSAGAHQFGLPAPRGLLLVGVQGCGKSLCAKAVGASWSLPLLRLDVGRMFAGLVGASERNIRGALAIADSLAPAVLWIDELDKAFAAASRSSGDGGTAARVLATLLTWMQEKHTPVFVLATANDVTLLPPELLRKGRFDELFFVDLPALHERAAIASVQLVRRGRDPSLFALDEIAHRADGFSGAEIEQAVIDGLFAAFQANRELTTVDITQALTDAIPLSRTMAESLQQLRRWADGRARPASRPLA
jgi:AAA+ superfamily predicted ATPase